MQQRQGGRNSRPHLTFDRIESATRLCERRTGVYADVAAKNGATREDSVADA
jgi:hypothetical protein